MIQFLYNFRRLALGLVLLASIFSCSDFLERPPEDNYSDNDFYYTNDQVNSRIAPLYYKPWWNMFSTSFWPMTETISGNMFNYTHLSFTQFTVTSSNSMLEDTWGSLYSVITQSNELINNLDDRAGGEVDQETIDIVKGEAYFLRAVAYFYLVRFWEEVPIIENTYDYIYSPQIPKNPKEDVYRFIEMDLAMAIDLLPEKIRGADYASNKRVSVGSAKSILAKVYLSQEKFAEAKNLAAEVINS
ncbi:RagB/SusD family nutrient uptake outer membrane protein [Zunongwangia sp. HGR-M22]|uniref:RagB/SusD family nutrient uptake outer membrane protein n=1 Tax=Zunongwangia sp. HGR-M22 TaxID=3015168 RepID=UPI0022DCF4F7|nr:RagB/SusD family nutrient uptake outer membrane protein [Zunongwangia sp. HGR-M22]WBL24938.1 RagB/SusD family nutrient uptake outer membrane protein [Zunongwangia sp. HGR-M22]